MAPAKVEDDPVMAEYDVFITPDIAEQLFLLQFPIRNRAQPYNERNSARPTEMRIKPNSGYLEMDVDMSTTHNFNKSQGLLWGKAMKKAESNGTASFGAASGFGHAGAAKTVRGQRSAVPVDEYVYGDIEQFNDALRSKQVFNKQTLGGQILRREEGTPNYMLGAFRGNELHLTRISGVAQLRPQFHHVDAATHAEKSIRESNTEDTRPPAQARAITQSYKDSRDGDNSRAMREKNLMQLAQEEQWTKMTYFDEDEAESYDAYHEKLFVPQTENAGRLESSMTNEEYLDAISAPRNDPGGRRKKKPLTRKQRAAIELAEDDVDHGDQPEAEETQEGQA